MVELDRVSFSYDKGREVLRVASFRARRGESIGIVGPNGAGKSTLMRLLVGLELGFTGSIKIAGVTVEKHSLARVREHIGYVFQDSESQLFMPTVGEDAAFGPRCQGLPDDEVDRRVADALERTGTSHLRNERIYKLSGGEKKLAAIASILAMSPEVICMDEPSSSLDPRNRRALMAVLKSLGCTKLIASHDLDMIWDVCERTILLSDGAVAADGPTHAVLSDRDLLEAHSLELPLFMQTRF